MFVRPWREYDPLEDGGFGRPFTLADGGCVTAPVLVSPLSPEEEEKAVRTDGVVRVEETKVASLDAAAPKSTVFASCASDWSSGIGLFARETLAELAADASLDEPLSLDQAQTDCTAGPGSDSALSKRMALARLWGEDGAAEHASVASFARVSLQVGKGLFSFRCCL
jgi:hypothetical protein